MTEGIGALAEDVKFYIGERVKNTGERVNYFSIRARFMDKDYCDKDITAAVNF